MLDILNLKFNPFQDLTPSLGQSSANINWAGMPTLKARFDKIIQDTATKRSRQIVLNLGPWGGGKTFTSIYYYNKAKRIGDNIITHIYVKSPKNDAKATEAFFKGVIEWLTFDKIRNQIGELITELGDEAFTDYINNRIRSKEIAKAILLIGSQDEATYEIMNRYIYGSLTKTELKNVGLPRGITDNSDRIKFISGIFYCFIGTNQISPGKVVLWVDEMEDLVYFSAKNYRTFSQDLRDLFDNLTQDFTSFLNFTFSEPEDATVEVILGAAIWSRITTKVRFKELSIDDSYTYCIEQIQQAQIRKRNLTPFSEDSIKHLLGIIPRQNMTPREINKKFTNVINFALENNHSAITKEIIDAEIAQETNED